MILSGLYVIIFLGKDWPQSEGRWHAVTRIKESNRRRFDKGSSSRPRHAPSPGLDVAPDLSGRTCSRRQSRRIADLRLIATNSQIWLSSAWTKSSTGYSCVHMCPPPQLDRRVHALSATRTVHTGELYRSPRNCATRAQRTGVARASDPIGAAALSVRSAGTHDPGSRHAREP